MQGLIILSGNKSRWFPCVRITGFKFKGFNLSPETNRNTLNLRLIVSHLSVINENLSTLFIFLRLKKYIEKSEVYFKTYLPLYQSTSVNCALLKSICQSLY